MFLFKKKNILENNSHIINKEVNMFLEGYVMPQVSAEKWAQIYGLTIKDCKCSICKKELKTIIPFASKKERGLWAGKCDCGNENTPFVFIRIDDGFFNGN